MSNDKITIELELTLDQAWQLASFAKRFTFSEMANYAVKSQDTIDAMDGLHALWRALIEAGIDPR